MEGLLVRILTFEFFFRQSSNELRSKNHYKSLAHSNDAILMNSLLYYFMYANIRNENVAMAIKVL